MLQFLHPFGEAPLKIAGQMQGDRTARSMLLPFATMVDSRKGGVMADRIDHLTERVQVVEVKVDRLASTVGQLSTRVDGLTTTVHELPTAMAAGFVEQREYTEFSHARLEAKMDAGYARLEGKMDAGFGRVDRKLDQLIDAQRPRAKAKRRNE